MVTGESIRASDAREASDGPGPVVRIDGRQPLSVELIGRLDDVCNSAEDDRGHGTVIVHVSGLPERLSADELSVALVSKWERVLRRMERLPAVTIAIADGDCGGAALDALLAADYRIARGGVRLLMTSGDGLVWPGMALYRLCHQAGAAVARRAVLFGTPIEADTALAVGLIDQLADDVTHALAVAAEVAGAWSPAELAIRRQLMLEAANTSFEDALGVHLAACDRVLRLPRPGSGDTRTAV